MADILLGSKRPSRAKKLARLVAIGVLLLGGAMLVGWFAFRRATTYSVPRGELPAGPLVAEGGRLVLGGASLEQAGALRVLRLTGDPYTIGAARGRLLGAAAAAGAALDATIIGERPPTSGYARLRHEGRLRWRYRLLADALTADRRRELAGLAAGLRAAGVPHAPTYQRLVWRQAALDVGAPPGTHTPFGGVAHALAFAVGGNVDAGGRVVVGRAFALPFSAGGAGDGDGGTNGVVISFVKEAGAIPFATIGWAGAVGVVTGVNAEGIAVALDPAVAENVRKSVAATPIALVAREVLTRAHTLDEAIAIISDKTPLGAGIFLVADGKARSFAVVERSPTKTAVIKGKTAALAIDDYLTAPEFDKDAENDRARRTRFGPARRARLDALLAKGVPPEAPAVAAVLRDRGGAANAPLPLGNGNAIDDLGQQHVAIIDASSMLLWVAEGPGAAGKLRAFDLRAELGDAAPRLTTTLDLPADPTLDPARAADVQAAHAALYEAQRLARARRRKLAADAVARAIALAPDLAEPYKLAGDLAHAARDDDAAAASYRRFLELHPAILDDIEAARTALGTP